MSITKDNAKLDSLADKLIDVAFNETYLSKPQVKEKIRIALSVWARTQTKRKSFDKIKSSQQELAYLFEKEQLEKLFWYDVFKELVTKDERQEYYNKFHQYMKENGYG